MPVSTLFWVLMVIWVVAGAAICSGVGSRWVYGSSGLLLFILLFLLGWKVFGFILR